MENIFKVRCSKIGAIMTEPKSKADKEAGVISETAKTFVKEQWLYNNYKYRDEVFTDEIMKGLTCEQDSISLVQNVLKGQFRLKSSKELENDYLTGHCDIDQDKEDVVEDIKTSFTIKTFFDAELTKDYEYQLRGYMALLGRSKARLIYCLIETPEDIITELKKRYYFKFNCDEDNEDYIRISKQIEWNHKLLLNYIPLEKRVKVFEINRDLDIENKIYLQVEKCRNFYNNLTI